MISVSAYKTVAIVYYVFSVSISSCFGKSALSFCQIDSKKRVSQCDLFLEAGFQSHLSQASLNPSTSRSSASGLERLLTVKSTYCSYRYRGPRFLALRVPCDACHDAMDSCIHVAHMRVHAHTHNKFKNQPINI